jgi:hypothetical protein
MMQSRISLLAVAALLAGGVALAAATPDATAHAPAAGWAPGFYIRGDLGGAFPPSEDFNVAADPSGIRFDFSV